MTRAEDARAAFPELPDPSVVDDAPPLPAEALELLRATGFPFRHDLEAAS
jgi:hypothetical protein